MSSCNSKNNDDDLEASMEEEVHVELDEELSALLIELVPEWLPYLRANRKLVLLLLKALYGCTQSARLFYNLLAKTLIAMGFVANPYDRCVFNKTIDGLQCTIVIYVDDLKISCVSSVVVDNVIKELQQYFTKLTIKRGKQLEYLGMELDFNALGCVSLSISKMVEDHHLTRLCE